MDLLKNCLKNMFRKKLRTILTITGIGIGVLSVVVISLIGEVGKGALNSELNSMGIGGLYVQSVSDSDSKIFGEAELQAIRKNENVIGATPLITKMMKIQARGLQSQAVVWGIDETATDIVSLDLKYGRMIHKSDVSSSAPVCIVDESFAQMFYKRDNIVGKTIQVKLDNQLVDFTVIGVVSSGGNILQGIMGDFVPTFLYAPFTTLSRYSGNDHFSQMVAKLSPTADEAAAEASIATMLNQELAGAGTVKVENLNTQKDKLNGILDIVTMILSIIGGISLVVAGISIMTVMLVTVHERTREIGIKKSIGANRRTILLEFLAEAFLLSLTGSIAGAALGLAIGFTGCAVLGLAFAVNIQSILFCIFFSLLTGILFGVYPAMKAAKLKPVDALRHE